MLFFDSVGIIIGRLRMFMQIVENTIGNVEHGQKIVSSVKYYRKRYTLNISYICSYYVHSVQFRSFKFVINS